MPVSGENIGYGLHLDLQVRCRFFNIIMHIINQLCMYYLPTFYYIFCSSCGFGCDRKIDLILHTIHHTSGTKEKFVSCPECGKMYSKNRLRGHLVNHYSDESLECLLCSKLFLYPEMLVKHRKTCKSHQKNQ